MPTLGEAFVFLERDWPALLGRAVRRMLYVGHRGDTHPWWRTVFPSCVGFPSCDVVDIVPANAQTAAGLEGVTRTFHGDIRVLDCREYDLVFWDEGPEHVDRAVALSTLARLAVAGSSVLISCPWGHQPQGSSPDDPEFHHWGPEPEDFLSIGYEARTFGTHFDGAGNGHGNLVAWSIATEG